LALAQDEVVVTVATIELNPTFSTKALRNLFEERQLYKKAIAPQSQLNAIAFCLIVCFLLN
jgi:hypothetical protein